MYAVLGPLVGGSDLYPRALWTCADGCGMRSGASSAATC